MGVMHFDFMSDKLGYQTNIYVTLPECMEKGQVPKGILYLLHGGGGNGLDWMRNTAIERYAQPYDLVVIMPEVDGSCFYADMVHGYPYFQYLTEEVPAAMEGMLAPIVKEEVTATIEVRETFHISKVGTVAGCMVREGKVKRTDRARLIRDGIVIHTGSLAALKRFKEDVKEVGTNFECGISLTSQDDIKVGDIIETFVEVEVKQKL